MTRLSAGLLLYRHGARLLEVLIVHPGGPFWSRRNDGVWSIPKGEVEEGADLAATAAREFREELGIDPPAAAWQDLGHVVQAGGKRVHAWACEGDLDVERVVSNEFEMEWPPRSGRRQRFPEIDRAAWVTPTDARRLLIPAQVDLLERLETLRARP